MSPLADEYEVFLTNGAERDLESIHDYLAETVGSIYADSLLELIESLAKLPERGSHPKELAALGIREYRQLLHKPYRIIYRAMSSKVVVYLIADERRDMQPLLLRRLLTM
ncbi:type II toxin-antitoxin system RelE/ParE family toxin [Neisseriaceae bacterium TC5R-5]|nr:type II toxin-antitoxin system RelE/ParE family toxin [Neisseriaceae bacterium TC5R-5]